MKELIVTSKTLFFPNNGEYTLFELEDSLTYNAHQTFYFVSKLGEVGILNCSNQIPKGVERIKEIFDKLFKDEYNFEDFRRDSLRQDAWRYFADKSAGNDIWHKHHMSGTPYKNNLTDEEMYSIKLVKEKS